MQAYITGNAFAILSDHQTLLQTVYDDDESPLRAIAFDEASGKIATATDGHVRIYKPFGLEDDALRVGALGFPVGLAVFHAVLTLRHRREVGITVSL